MSRKQQRKKIILYFEIAYTNQKGKCYWCGSQMRSICQRFKGHVNNLPLTPTVEHLKPVSKGGRRATPENIVAACRGCNGKRGNNENKFASQICSVR